MKSCSAGREIDQKKKAKSTQKDKPTKRKSLEDNPFWMVAVKSIGEEKRK